MANETTQTTLDDLCQAVIQEARIVTTQGVRLRDYIRYKKVPQGKSGALFPEYGQVTAAGLTEGTDISSPTQVSTSGVTLTPTEHGLMPVLTDLADYASNPVDVASDIGKVCKDAIVARENQLIWALFDGFSQTAGKADTDITEANIASCVRQLISAQAPRPYYMAITPHVLEDLYAIYSTNTNFTSNDLRNMVLDKGVLPPIYGVIPLVVDNLASGTSAGKADSADAKCGVFSPMALGFAELWDIRIEPERNASLRAWELVVTSAFAVGELKDTWGVELLVDNKD